MFARSRVLASLAVTALALALALGAATTALAIPAGPPTLGLTELRQMLAASSEGTISAYFKTVLRGQTIETIPCTILGTTGDSSGGALILFEATGAKIEKFGGIVAGMSGSPIYVNVGGTDKIVGAVSYGDWFTLGGTGLATPIDAMLALKTTYASAVFSMQKPVLADGRLISRVIVSPQPQKFVGASAVGALVAKPLNTGFIGGLRPGSKPYVMLSKALARRGMAVASDRAPLDGGALDPASMVATDLVPGASVAAMDMRGDAWSGGIGTVTYNQGSDVLAFGHPDYWNGETSLYMMNAWIDGVWPSQLEPYKMGSPTLVRGTITQDRFAGILGKVDQMPEDTTITAHVTNADTGESTSTATYVPRTLLNTGKENGFYVAAALAVGAQKLIDTWSIDGSAQTTTTVEVSDGTRLYSLVIPNMYDSQELDWDVMWDAYNVISQLQHTAGSGTQALDIRSVDLQMNYTKTRRNAQIAGVDVVGGLRAGDNTATVTYVAYGHSDFVTQAVPFTLPTGTPLAGALSAASAYDGYYADDYYSMFDESSYVETPGVPTDWYSTVSGTVGDLAATQPNNIVALSFQPFGSGRTQPIAIETSSTTPWYLTGAESLASPRVLARLMMKKIPYRGTTLLAGSIYGPERNGTVSIYGTPSNSTTESLLARFTAKYRAEMGGATFMRSLGDFTTNTNLRIRFEPSDGWLSGDATATIHVTPIVRLSPSKTTIKAGKRVTLTATVIPSANVGGKVTFQVWSPSWDEWRTISIQTLHASGSAAKASYSWKPGKGNRKVRVKFMGTPFNASSHSSSHVIHVQ